MRARSPYSPEDVFLRGEETPVPSRFSFSRTLVTRVPKNSSAFSKMCPLPCPDLPGLSPSARTPLSSQAPSRVLFTGGRCPALWSPVSLPPTYLLSRPLLPSWLLSNRGNSSSQHRPPLDIALQLAFPSGPASENRFFRCFVSHVLTDQQSGSRSQLPDRKD